MQSTLVIYNRKLIQNPVIYNRNLIQNPVIYNRNLIQNPDDRHSGTNLHL